MASVRYDIAAANPLFGAGAFVALALPEGWELAAGPARPEIAACHMRQGRRWVVSGEAWYMVQHHDHAIALELSIAIQMKPRRQEEGAARRVGEHRAHLRHWVQRRGLFRRWNVHFSELAWYCPQTERGITVTLSSRAPHQAFEEVVMGLEGTSCHS